jgi:hypothetical protein
MSRCIAVAAAAALFLLAGCVTGDVKRCGAGFGSTDARAVEILKSAGTLESSHTGDGGVASCFVIAYRHLVRQRDAAGLFTKLFEEAAPTGKIYALAGLYETDRAAFDRLVVTAPSWSPGSFDRLSTCVFDRVGQREVIAQLRNGELSAWWRPQGRTGR